MSCVDIAESDSVLTLDVSTLKRFSNRLNMNRDKLFFRFFAILTSRKPQKRITYYPKCMVRKFHRKEHVEFRFQNCDFDVRDKKCPGQPKKLKNVELQQLHLNETVTANCYQQQLCQLSDELMQKRSVANNRCIVILLHDNARPHVAKSMKQTLL